jgi:hypothetical protein
MQCITKGAWIFQPADAVFYGAERSLLPAIRDNMSRIGRPGEGPRLLGLPVTNFAER